MLFSKRDYTTLPNIVQDREARQVGTDGRGNAPINLCNAHPDTK